MRTTALLVALGCASLAPAMAQNAGPQVPSPTNPFPDQPIATNGSPLPESGYSADPDIAPGGPLPVRPHRFVALKAAR